MFLRSRSVFNRTNKYKVLATLLVAVCLSACASNKPYKHAAPGLVEVSHHKYFDRVLMTPGASLPTFSKIFIEEPSVSINDHWLRSFRSQFTERDLDRIKTSYGKLLKESLIEGVSEKKGFVLVDSATAAEVIFRPSLDSLNIYAPDLSFHGRIDQYIHEAGNATFNLQLVDVRSGEVVAQFVDHSETFSNPTATAERTNRALNARYFGRLMDRWANNLMTYLTETNAFSSAE